jgi:hypothetical protein
LRLAHNETMNILRISTTAALIVAASSAALAQTEKQGTTYRSPGGATLKLMLDDSNVGPEVTVGELTFPRTPIPASTRTARSRCSTCCPESSSTS